MRIFQAILSDMRVGVACEYVCRVRTCVEVLVCRCGGTEESNGRY